ncbi:ATP-binding protein [Yinghuangia seranimata]|uniref:ATP-binding protein n=1 Tax=Yinghuangia seranimata TaxID=408067 RepID=UPI00248B2F65|nr:helix-turn-helix transcriptional regulator [Yinghuangia seranimata]MDI2129897.1 AAA family ATPase [Yinghuangia seranimata]
MVQHLGFGTGFDTPFVGRGTEISWLDDALERARSGDPRAVLVAGEAGVGKTRLLDEAGERARGAGMTVLTGHCIDLGEVGLPYFPFTEILRDVEDDPGLAEVLEAYPAVQRLLRGGAPSGSTAAEGAGVRLRLLEEVAALLAELAERAPLLVVVEDLHWADQSTRDLLRFLLSRLQPQRSGGAAHQRIAVLASYRSDDLHRRHPVRPLLAELVRLPVVGRLDLGPMDDEDVAALVRALGAEQLSEETVRGIVERAEGNAFYAEELRVAAAEDTMAGVPSGLAEVLLTRIEQLSNSTQRVLRTAAVAGRRVEHGLLRDALELPDDELDTALREAIGRHLLVADPGGATYSFRHALTRDAAYSDLLPGERVRLHGEFARLLGVGARRAGSAAERAHHHRESHDLPGALTASLEAADHAARVAAPAEELRHVETALEIWDAVPDAEELTGTDDVALMLRASAAAVRMGEGHRAVALARAALDRVGSHGDTNLAAKVRYTLASNLMSVDNLEAALEFSSQALALIPADPPTLTWVWAASTHTLAAFYARKDRTALELGLQAIKAAEELNVPDAMADVLITLTAIDDNNRTTAPGREQLRRAADLARQAGNVAIELRALYNLALGCHETAELDECLRWLDEGRERARRTAQTNAPYALEMRYLRALVLYTVGRWDEAVEAAGTAPSTFGHVADVALYVAQGRGDPGVAARARALYDRKQSTWMAQLVGGLLLVEDALARRDPDGAAEWARRAMGALSAPENPLPDAGVRFSALVLAAVGDASAEARLSGDAAAVARLTALADEFVDLARATATKPARLRRPDGPEGVAWLRRAEAERARADGTVDPDVWAGVVEAYGYGNVYEQARAKLRLVEALILADRRADAAVVADEVRATAADLRAVPLAEAVDALARRARLGGSASAAGPATVLTGREQEVLALLAKGRSNRQIGEALFISTKTASVHVSNILAKLGAASRTEAVALAYRAGLIDQAEAEG